MTRTQRQQASALLQDGQYAAAQLLYEEMCRANPKDDEAWFTLGAIHHQLGEPGKAMECYTRTISLKPNHADALYYLGTLLQNADKLDEAISCYQRALSIKPDYPGAHCNLGTALESQKRFDEAVGCYRQALHHAPNNPELHYNLGNALKSLVRLEDAVGHYRTALRLKPDFAQAHANLGGVLDERGHTQEARAHLNEALRLNPDYPEALNNLGYLLQGQHLLAEAIALFKRAISLRPGYAEAYNNLGLAYADEGEVDQALACYQHALLLKSDMAEVYNNLAGIFKDKGDHDQALAIYEHALQINPNNPLAHYNLGNVLMDLGQLEQSVARYREAMAQDPNLTPAHNNMGNVLKQQGRLDQGISSYDKVLQLGSDPGTHSNMLLTLNYHATMTSEVIFAEHVRWGEVHTPALTHAPYSNPADPERKLRVGYVSPDFRSHSVAFFFEAVLAHHDPASVETYCYASVVRPDAMTERLKQRSHHWRNIRGKNDDDVAALIRADAIDILVDLAGHTGDNRLPVFARKPAPVQVSYLGYPNTTGLKTMDYRLTDLEADPIGQEAFHTEKLVRLPHGFLCYTPPPDATEVAALPALAAGHVTFGSFNNLAKMTPEVIGLWARILKAVPGSRLMIKNKSMKDGPTRERYLALFRDAGIGEERLDLVAWIPEAAGHLGAYTRVDIALDTFPYNGTTTTCEALWMGVPVITLAGDRHSARVGVSLLSQVGLTELIAQTPEKYVKLAVELAGDTEHLVKLRVEMRERMKNSPLCDAKSFTRDLEAAYREMWGRWCTQQSARGKN
jgi:predicted O-linked N-acetylglucosamine transferase (SPINDLY family)